MLRRNKGQTTVEFALCCILFFMFIFSIMDFAIMFFVNQTMQHAVRSGARLAVTGSNVNNTGRLATMIAEINDQSMGFYDKNAHNPKTPTFCSQSLLSNYTTHCGAVIADPGAAQQIVTVKLDYTWPLLTPFVKPFFTGGNYNFTVQATVVNEPFQ